MSRHRVLMVAEKPSLAQSIAQLLADRQQVHDCSCMGQDAPDLPPDSALPLIGRRIMPLIGRRIYLLLREPFCPPQPIACLLMLQVHSRRGYLEVHEFEGHFQGAPAHFRMTSVIGHVLSIDFLPQFQNWETTPPAALFDAPTKKSESNPKVLIHQISHNHILTDVCVREQKWMVRHMANICSYVDTSICIIVAVLHIHAC